MEQTRVEEEEGEKLWGNEEKGNWAICLGISYSQTFVVAAVCPVDLGTEMSWTYAHFPSLLCKERPTFSIPLTGPQKSRGGTFPIRPFLKKRNRSSNGFCGFGSTATTTLSFAASIALLVPHETRERKAENGPRAAGGYQKIARDIVQQWKRGAGNTYTILHTCSFLLTLL